MTKKILLKIFLFYCFFVSFAYADFESLVKKAIDSENIAEIEKISMVDLEFKERNSLGMNALAYALLAKKNISAKYLIERKIGLNVVDYFGRTPLLIGLSNSIPKELLEQYLSSTANLYLTDKFGNNAIAYANKSKNPEYISLINQKMSKFPPLNEEKVKELKNILTNSSVIELDSFFSKNHTLSFNMSSDNLEMFISNHKLLPRFGVEVLQKYGLNIFEPHFVINLFANSSESEVLSFLKYRINLDATQPSLNVPLVVLQSNLSEDTIIKVLDLSQNLKIKDNDGNTLLHLAIKKNKSKVVRYLLQKGVDLNSKNNFGISAYLLLPELKDSKLIEETIKNYPVDISVVNSEGDNFAIVLGKKNPEVLEKVLPVLIQAGVDISKANKNNEKVSDYIKNVDVASNQVEDVLKNIPDIDSSKVNDNFLEIKNFEEQIKDNQEKLKLSDVFSGDREFDAFLTSSVEGYLLSLRQKAYANLTGSSDNQLALLNENKITLNREIQNSELLLKELENENQRLLTKVQSSSFKNVTEKTRHVQTSIAKFHGSLVQYFNEVAEDFQSLSEAKKELEEKIVSLKLGKDNIRQKIEELKKENLIIKNNFEKTKKSKEDHLTELAKYHADQKKEFEQRLDTFNKNLSSLNREVSDLNDLINKNRDNIVKNRDAINSVAHKDEHIEDASKCRYVKAIELSEYSIRSAQDRLKQIKPTEAMQALREKIQKAQLDLSAVISNNESELKKLQDENASWVKKSQNDLDLQIFQIKSEIDSLVKISDIELKNVLQEAKLQLRTIKESYGELDSAEKDFSRIRNLLIENNSVDKIQDLYFCAMDICQVKNEYVRLFEQSKLGTQFLDLVKSGADKIPEVIRNSKSMEQYNGVSSEITLLSKRIKESKLNLAEKKKNLENLESECQELTLELNQQSSDESSEQVFQQILDLEEQKYLYEFKSNNSSHINQLQNAINFYKNENSLSGDTSFSKIEKRVDHTSSRKFKFETLNYTNWNSVTLVPLSEDETSEALGEWHNLLVKSSYSNGHSILNSSMKRLFVQSLLGQVVVSLAKFNENETLFLRSGKLTFLIADDGRVVDVKDNLDDLFGFKLVSSGVVREKVIETMKILKQRFKGFSVEELNKDYDFYLLKTLIKKADEINSLDKTIEILNTVQMLAALWGPGGNFVAKALGLSECAIQMYKTYALGVKMNLQEAVTTGATCFESFVNNYAFNKVIPSKALALIIRNALGKISDNKLLLNKSKDVFELLFSIRISQIDFEKNVLKFINSKKVLPFLFFIKNHQVGSGKIKLYNTDFSYAHIRLESASFFESISIDGLEIVNICTGGIDQVSFTEEVKKKFFINQDYVKFNVKFLPINTGVYMDGCIGVIK